MAKKRRCLKRSPSRVRSSHWVKGPCIKWAKTGTAKKRKPAAKKRKPAAKKTMAGQCVSVPGAFRMSTKVGYKCACVAKTKKGTLMPKFLPHNACGKSGTAKMNYASAKRLAAKNAPFPLATN